METWSDNRWIVVGRRLTLGLGTAFIVASVFIASMG